MYVFSVFLVCDRVEVSHSGTYLLNICMYGHILITVLVSASDSTQLLKR